MRRMRSIVDTYIVLITLDFEFVHLNTDAARRRMQLLSPGRIRSISCHSGLSSLEIQTQKSNCISNPSLSPNPPESIWSKAARRDRTGRTKARSWSGRMMSSPLAADRGTIAMWLVRSTCGHAPLSFSANEAVLVKVTGDDVGVVVDLGRSIHDQNPIPNGAIRYGHAEATP